MAEAMSTSASWWTNFSITASSGLAIHLSVGHHDARFRDQLLEPGAGLLHRFDPVMDEVDLPAAPQFAQHRLAHGLSLDRTTWRANRQPAWPAASR